MRILKLTVAYDGTAYAGWQRQPGEPTIQATLEGALEKITGRTVRTTASGRTDAGVHALGQVVSCTLPRPWRPERLQKALNANLPLDVAVIDVTEANIPFHPVRDAARKRYRYVIHDGPVRSVFLRHYAWHCPCRLDVPAMARAAEALVGTHDFTSFQSAGAPRPTRVRTVYELAVTRGEHDQRDLVTIETEADGFLYHMVRAIVGTLVEVGRGARPPGWVRDVLHARDRGRAGATAPPEGLFLVHVEYAKEKPPGGRGNPPPAGT